MKQKSKYSSIALLLFGVVLIVTGCGGSSGTGITTGISGSASVLTGQIQSSAKAKDFTGYRIYAMAKSTHKVYYATVSIDGSFSLTVEQNGSYILTLVRSDSHVAGVLSPGALGNDTVVTGIKTGASSAVDIGSFVLDETKGVASAAGELSAVMDSSLKARAASGKIVGQGNLGKGAEAKLTAGNSVNTQSPDQDDDGLVDALDADADGDGVVDEIQSGELAVTKSGKASACIKNISVLMSLKIAYENSNTFDTKKDMVLALEVTPANSTCAADISKVELLNGPSFLATAAISASASGYVGAYPTAGILWTNVSVGSYDMVSMTPPSDTTPHWVIWLVPNGTVTAGDSFHFKVSYKSSHEEHFVKMLDYVFTDIPRLLTYNGNAAPAPMAGGSGSSINAAAVGRGDLTLTWSRPKDETGAEISALVYVFTVHSFSSSGSELESSQCTSVSDAGGTLAVTLSASSCLPAVTASGTAIAYYQIDIAAVSTAGDVSAQLFYVKK